MNGARARPFGLARLLLGQRFFNARPENVLRSKHLTFSPRMCYAKPDHLMLLEGLLRHVSLGAGTRI